MAQALPKHRAREYETIFIVNPETPTDQVETLATRVTDVISRLEGKLLRAENWGRRRLAYPVRKHNKGTYVYLRYLGYSDMVLELERNLRMIEPVIKHLTIKLDEDVNPEVRPVREEEISFVPEFEDEPEVETPDLSATSVSDDTDDVDDDDDDDRRDRKSKRVDAADDKADDDADDKVDDKADDSEEEEE